MFKQLTRTMQEVRAGQQVPNPLQPEGEGWVLQSQQLCTENKKTYVVWDWARDAEQGDKEGEEWLTQRAQ
jgi:hypothetical protein